MPLFGKIKIDRNAMTTPQLHLISTSEIIITQEINNQLEKEPDIFYKNIYIAVKKRLQSFATTINGG
jgi:hypothetical protein